MLHEKFSEKFGKLITAMVTPFQDNYSIDFKALEVLIEHLIKTGSTSILITGTTGENPTLTYEEEWELLKACKNIINNRVPIIFGAGSNCTKTSIEVAKKAVSNGVDAIMLVAPYYNKPNQDGLFEHFCAITKEINNTPVLLYNNPGRTCSYIQSGTIAKLHETCPNIQAIKESRSEQAIDTITQLRIIAPSFEIYSGDDGLILPVLALGGVGLVSVASHLVGKELTFLMNSFLCGNHEEASEKFNKLYPLIRSLFSSTSPGPVKYLLSEKNICKPYLRLPLTQPADKIKESLKEIFEEISKTPEFINISKSDQE